MPPDLGEFGCRYGNDAFGFLLIQRQTFAGRRTQDEAVNRLRSEVLYESPQGYVIERTLAKRRNERQP